MKEKLLRGLALLAALLLLLFFCFFPLAEKSNGSSNNGRKKFSLQAGESLSWGWMPEVDQVTEVAIRITGKAESQNIMLKVEAINSSGEIVFSSEQAVSEMEDTDEIILKGSFSGEKKYVLRISAEGKGSVRVRGTETEEGFQPAFNWTGMILKRDRKLLYFAAGCFLIALFPLPARKETKGRIRKWILFTGLIFPASTGQFAGIVSEMEIIKPSVFLLPNIISARFPIAGTSSGFSFSGGI